MDWEVWGPPLAVLTISSVIGSILIQRTKGEEGIDQRAEFLAQKGQLLEAIRELDADQVKMDAEVFQAERKRLISAASVVLQKLDGKTQNVDIKGVNKRMSGRSLFGYLGGTFLFFALVGFLISKYSAPRQEGGIMTGGQMPETPAIDWDQLRQDRIEAANKVLETDPDNIEALNMLTYDALLVRDMPTSMDNMEKVRNLNSEDPDFIVHLAMLQMTVGMYERAEVGFDQALKIRPDFPKAKLWKGYMLISMQKKEEALIVLDSITSELNLPEEEMLLRSLKSDLAAPPAMITGTVSLSEGVESPAGILFIIAKRAAVGGGPPVAVKRIPNPVFPLSFDLGKSDMVMGGQWPEMVFLSARIDLDGNAMTKEEAPKTGEVLEVKGTQEGLELLLVNP